MIERLRLWLSRPFSDGERHRAFTVSAVVLVALAGGLSAISEQPNHDNANPWPPDGPVTELIGEARRLAPEHAPPEVGRVALRFLSGYLKYVYGRASAHTIKGASPALVAGLSSRRVRVSVGMRNRRPRIAGLETHPLNGDWLIAAEIADGEARFPVELIVTGNAGGWVVAQVVED